MKYILKHIKNLSIDESSKEDFKKMMGWDERQWEFYTEKRLK